jgi:thiosulfate dehydrogenase [quinone] large subunit
MTREAEEQDMSGGGRRAAKVAVRARAADRTRQPAGPGGREQWRRRAADPAWLLLPQRLFLGVTFTKAGVDKLIDPAFFDPAQPTSMAGQIASFRATSPIRPLLSIAAAHPTAVGVLMALGEIAVGIATLLGVRVRLAAVGGALISLSLLLTVTWRTRPYYYGSDIVFLFCWLPLIGYGSGPLSLQAYLERRRPASRDEPWASRRALLGQLGVAAGAIALTAGGAGLFRRGPGVAAGAGAPAPPASTGRPTAEPTQQPDAAQPLAAVGDVQVGGVLPVTGPTGTAAFLVRVGERQFVAFDRTCTHAGCQVDVAADQKSFRCPCHSGQFDARTGAVLAGPPPRPLDQIPVKVSGDQVVPGG